jgi:hypothetical protein
MEELNQELESVSSGSDDQEEGTDEVPSIGFTNSSRVRNDGARAVREEQS